MTIILTAILTAAAVTGLFVWMSRTGMSTKGCDPVKGAKRNDKYDYYTKATGRNKDGVWELEQ